jgi:hypothetical protein
VIENTRDYYFALPYKAAKKPIVGSQFTSNEITMIFTIISFYINGIRNQDVDILLTELYKKYVIMNISDKVKSIELKLYDEFIGPYIKDNIPLHQNPHKNSIMNYAAIKKEREIIKYYLKYVVFTKYCVQYESQFNISYYDIMSGLVIKNNSGLTGTPFVHLIE